MPKAFYKIGIFSIPEEHEAFERVSFGNSERPQRGLFYMNFT